MAFLRLQNLLIVFAVCSRVVSNATHLGRRAGKTTSIAIPSIDTAGQAVLPSFVSFSIEFAFFPDFAGNKTSPNYFSDYLLDNLGALQGNKPDIRVGGNTQ